MSAKMSSVVGMECIPLLIDVVSTRFHYFKIVPPASPYIIIPPCGNMIYELAGGNILNQQNVVDPNSRARVVELCPPVSSYINPFIHYCDHGVAKVNACVISTYGM
jgi:hypothetical protein